MGSGRNSDLFSEESSKFVSYPPTVGGKKNGSVGINFLSPPFPHTNYRTRSTSSLICIYILSKM